MTMLETLRHVAMYRFHAGASRHYTTLYFLSSGQGQHPMAHAVAEWAAYKHREHLSKAHNHRVAVEPDRSKVGRHVAPREDS